MTDTSDFIIGYFSNGVPIVNDYKPAATLRAVPYPDYQQDVYIIEEECERIGKRTVLVFERLLDTRDEYDYIISIGHTIDFIWSRG
jgi:hypothetical protein